MVKKERDLGQQETKHRVEDQAEPHQEHLHRHRNREETSIDHKISVEDTII